MNASNQSPKIVMAHSYKGGTGKTAFTINLAKYLAVKEKKKILLIEQDTGGSTFTNIFKVKPELYWNDFYNSNRLLKELIISHKDFDIICAYEQENLVPEGETSKLFMARQVERIQREIKYLKSTYDFIIIDTRPGYTIDMVTSVIISDIAILMSRVDTDTISKTIDLFDKIYSNFTNKDIFLIQNQVPEEILGYDRADIDLDVEHINTIWNEFSKNKEVITIPLRNDIAYPLSLSKLLPLDNILFNYISSFWNKISKL